MDENDTRSSIPNVVQEIADAVGGTITEVGGPLSDGSGFAVMSIPLKKTHWIYQGDKEHEWGVSNVPPMPFRMGGGDQVSLLLQKKNSDRPFGVEPPIRMRRDDFADRIRAAGKYAVRSSTMNGREMDFDPDALLQNLVVGMLGYWTDNGLSSDEWDNPDGGGGVNWKAPEKEKSVLPEALPSPIKDSPDS